MKAKFSNDRFGFNSLEFGGIKQWVIHLFPNAKEFDGVFITKPFLY